MSGGRGSSEAAKIDPAWRRHGWTMNLTSLISSIPPDVLADGADLAFIALVLYYIAACNAVDFLSHYSGNSLIL